ncbi:hypothetical protein HHL28_03125 [Aerophototrophica crusticola]|uniref:Uncharacterized protein n=1 Tax=Aerophototrophica crusticola TaxID=1709002 RepID=A0A858R4A9_9PROT|nr:hypothetical protein HHL28_03125 [Rhodospirillaceae bacterium B3]
MPKARPGFYVRRDHDPTRAIYQVMEDGVTIRVCASALASHPEPEWVLGEAGLPPGLRFAAEDLETAVAFADLHYATLRDLEYEGLPPPCRQGAKRRRGWLRFLPAGG